jgi:Lrp/AsnC family transcriptional regulator
MANGVIQRRVALLVPEKIDVVVNVFVSIRTNQHFCSGRASSVAPPRRPRKWSSSIRVSGRVDYLLRIVAPHIAAYDDVYRRLIEAADLYDVTSSFAMETIQYATALPLHDATTSA